MNPGLLAEDRDNMAQRLDPLREEFRGRRIFLAGGTGFFGKWLLESFCELNRRYALRAHLTVLSRNPHRFLAEHPRFADVPDLTFVPGDVRRFEFPPERFDCVIHGATEVNQALDRDHPDEMYSMILEGTRRVVEFAAAAGAGRMLFVSSGAVYGAQPPSLARIPEDFLESPHGGSAASAYGRGKRDAERFCADFGAREGLAIATARCFAFVGPHLPLDAHFAIGNFLRDGMDRRPIIIQGDGTPMRSYMYMSDLAVWLWTILLRGRGGRAYNVGSDQAVSVADLAAEVNRCCGGHSEIRVLQPANPDTPPQRYIPEIGRAKRELHLAMEFDLRHALEKTIRWHRR